MIGPPFSPAPEAGCHSDTWPVDHRNPCHFRQATDEDDMADINVDEIGPVDYLVVGFPPTRRTSRARWRPS